MSPTAETARKASIQRMDARTARTAKQLIQQRDADTKRHQNMNGAFKAIAKIRDAFKTT
jgi:hypothetical protein